MSDSLKLGISLLILVSIFFLCVSLALFFIKENEKDKRLSLEDKLEEVFIAKDELEKSLNEIELINKDLESKLNNTHLEIKSLAEDHASEKKERELLVAQLDKEKEEVKRLVSDMMNEKEERVSLVQKLAQAENDYRELKARLEVIVQAKETLEKKVKEIIAEKGVELEKIIVQAGTPAESFPKTVITEPPPSEFIEEEAAPDGEVLITNRKFGFIIINIGKSDGLNLGDNLEIYRSGKFIADAQVEKLYDRMSAATMSPQHKKTGIRVGDEVLIQSE